LPNASVNISVKLTALTPLDFQQATNYRSRATMTSEPASKFLSVPREVRDEIYGQLLYFPEGLRKLEGLADRGADWLAKLMERVQIGCPATYALPLTHAVILYLVQSIMLVNRQVSAEAKQKFYSINTYRFGNTIAAVHRHRNQEGKRWEDRAREYIDAPSFSSLRSPAGFGTSNAGSNPALRLIKNFHFILNFTRFWNFDERADRAQAMAIALLECSNTRHESSINFLRIDIECFDHQGQNGDQSRGAPQVLKLLDTLSEIRGVKKAEIKVVQLPKELQAPHSWAAHMHMLEKRAGEVEKQMELPVEGV
jgi:hypothetical protein